MAAFRPYIRADERHRKRSADRSSPRSAYVKFPAAGRGYQRADLRAAGRASNPYRWRIREGFGPLVPRPMTKSMRSPTVMENRELLCQSTKVGKQRRPAGDRCVRETLDDDYCAVPRNPQGARRRAADQRPRRSDAAVGYLKTATPA